MAAQRRHVPHPNVSDQVGGLTENGPAVSHDFRLLDRVQRRASAEREARSVLFDLSKPGDFPGADQTTGTDQPLSEQNRQHGAAAQQSALIPVIVEERERLIKIKPPQRPARRELRPVLLVVRSRLRKDLGYALDPDLLPVIRYRQCGFLIQIDDVGPNSHRDALATRIAEQAIRTSRITQA